jgi:hypothetical protein
VEHPCDKCGVKVEDGTAFCPQCGLPQIRVVSGASTQPTTESSEIDADVHAGYPPLGATLFRWPQAFPPAGFALLSAALLIFLLGAPPGLAMLAAGFLSVLLYRRRYPLAGISLGLGIRIGALTGFLGFVLLAVILGIAASFRSAQEVHSIVLKYVQEYASRTGDPRMQEVLALFNTSGGFALLIVLSLFLTCIAFLFFSGLGGALGAALLRRKGPLR